MELNSSEGQTADAPLLSSQSTWSLKIAQDAIEHSNNKSDVCFQASLLLYILEYVKHKKELLKQASELLYRANEVQALLKNSIRQSIENREDLSYILTGCNIMEQMQNELIALTDIHERECM